MPRRAPIDPQGIYHVGTRGNFGEPLFQSNGEHELYLELYAKFASKQGWTTLAWTLLFNHHHFLIRLRDGGLSEGMQSINHGFSRRMNAVYGRTGKGHLVRHGFFARRIADDRDFIATSLYIDRNAVEARRCVRPEDWRWSGCAATLGLARPRPFHDVRAQLALLSSRTDRARVRYARLLDAEPSQARVTTSQRAPREGGLVIRSGR